MQGLVTNNKRWTWKKAFKKIPHMNPGLWRQLHSFRRQAICQMNRPLIVRRAKVFLLSRDL